MGEGRLALLTDDIIFEACVQLFRIQEHADTTAGGGQDQGPPEEQRHRRGHATTVRSVGTLTRESGDGFSHYFLQPVVCPFPSIGRKPRKKPDMKTLRRSLCLCRPTSAGTSVVDSEHGRWTIKVAEV
jgi:hypothetical protein